MSVFAKLILRCRWIAALRSGRYDQGSSALHHGPTRCFCCLGVLLDVLDPSGWSPREGTTCRAHTLAEITENACGTKFPSAEIMGRVGLTRKDAEQLATLNDVESHTFEDIATLLEILPCE